MHGVLKTLTQTIFGFPFLDAHGIEFNVLTPILSEYHELDILMSLISYGVVEFGIPI